MTDRLEALNSMGWAIDVRLRPPGIGGDTYVITATRFDGETLSVYHAHGRTLEIAERRLLAALNFGAGSTARASDLVRQSA